MPQEPLQGQQCVNICTGGAILVRTKMLHEKAASWRTSQSEARQGAPVPGGPLPCTTMIKSPTPTGLPTSGWLNHYPDIRPEEQEQSDLSQGNVPSLPM